MEHGAKKTLEHGTWGKKISGTWNMGSKNIWNMEHGISSWNMEHCTLKYIFVKIHIFCHLVSH